MLLLLFQGISSPYYSILIQSGVSLHIFLPLSTDLYKKTFFLKKITHKLSKWLHPSPLAQITLLIWLHLITNKQTNKTPLDSSGSLRIFYKVHDTWPLTSRNSQSDEAVAIINNSSRTNYSVIQTVEKLMWHLSCSPRAERRVGWGLKGAHNPANSSLNWRFQKTDWYTESHTFMGDAYLQRFRAAAWKMLI